MTDAPDAVLFDKDGTLVDFAATWAPWSIETAHIVARDSGVAAERIASDMRLDLSTGRFHPDSPLIAGTPDDLATLLQPYYRGAEPEEILERITPPDGAVVPVPVEGLVSCLDALARAGVALGVVTNDFEAQTHKQLAHLGIDAHFSVVVGYDSGHGAKPASAGCLAAAKALGARADATVMVGDSLHDLDAGRAAGMRCVGVLTGVAERDVLAPRRTPFLTRSGRCRAGWIYNGWSHHFAYIGTFLTPCL